MKFKALILDFDGTIADTAESIVLAMQGALNFLGYNSVKDDEIKNLIGLPLRDMFKEVPNFKDELVENGVVEYNKRHKDLAMSTITLFPDVKETLEYLHSKGVKLGIATSRGRESLIAFLKLLEIEDLFLTLACAEDVTNHKPAPDVVNLVLKNLSVDKKDALVVGDTIYDVGMGKNAGCDTCAVTYGNNSISDLKKSSPEYIIDNFKELIKIVEG